MGTMHYSNRTMRGVIRESLEDTHRGRLRAVRCVEACWRGNKFSGILWSRWQNPSFPVESLIMADRITCKGNAIWHSTYTEQDGPYAYSCPLKYLEAPTVYMNPSWRDSVIEYHARRAAKRNGSFATK